MQTLSSWTTGESLNRETLMKGVPVDVWIRRRDKRGTVRHPETSPRAAGTREEPRADTWENRSRQVLRLETLLLPGQFVGAAP